MHGGSYLQGLLQGPLYCVFVRCLPALLAKVEYHLCFPTGVMTSRQTNTSQEVALFGIPLSVAARNYTSTSNT